jgi:hypothetical protein
MQRTHAKHAARPIGRNQNAGSRVRATPWECRGWPNIGKIHHKDTKDTKFRPNIDYLCRVGESAGDAVSLVFFVSLW